MILTIIIFVLALGLLVLVHELGHFVSAKKIGVKVEEFGFGFPPRIFSFKKGETIYSINLFPIGGFVRLFGEERGLKKTKSKRAFYNKPIWQRAVILVMGVVMNLLIAVLFFSIANGIGVPVVVKDGSGLEYKNVQVQIMEVAEASPAEKAGIRLGDSITGLVYKNEKVQVKEVEDIQDFIVMHLGKEITFEIKRGKEIIEKSVVPRISPPENEGAVGIAMAKVGIIKFPWYSAIWEAIKTIGQLIYALVIFFYDLIKTLLIEGSIIKGVGGPVAIFVYTSVFAKLGLIYVLRFIAILSVSLAVLNAVPFPALDGGRLLFLGIEKIKGSPINIKTERIANTIGFLLLIIFMIALVVKDINKFIL